MSGVVKNIGEMHRRLVGISQNIRKGAGRAIVKAGREIRDASQPKVPVDKGKLKRSVKGRVTLSEDTGRVKVVISYRAIDPRTGFDYAPWQHEITWYRHKKGTGPQYLHGPARKLAPKIKKWVIEESAKAALPRGFFAALRRTAP